MLKYTYIYKLNINIHTHIVLYILNMSYTGTLHHSNRFAMECWMEFELQWARVGPENSSTMR